MTWHSIEQISRNPCLALEVRKTVLLAVVGGVDTFHHFDLALFDVDDDIFKDD